MRIVVRVRKDHFRALMAYIECLRACPSSKLDAVMEQYTMLVEYNCSPAYNGRMQEGMFPMLISGYLR